MFLEGRVLSVIYRLNFSADIFWLLNFVKAGTNVLIDFEPVNFVNRIIQVGEIITIIKNDILFLLII